MESQASDKECSYIRIVEEHGKLYCRSAEQAYEIVQRRKYRED